MKKKLSNTRIPQRFTGLHCHSGFSLFDGMGLPQEHFDFVMKNSADESAAIGMALTEHGHCNSFAHAYLYAKELNSQGKNFKFLPGCELYVHPDLKLWREHKAERDENAKTTKTDEQHGSTVENEEESKSSKFYDPVRRRHHLVVLAKTSKGLQSLFKVVSRGYIEGFYRFPRVDYDMLKEFKGDFVVSTACIGGPLAYDVFSHFPDASFEELVPSLVDDDNIRAEVLSKMQNTVDQIVDAVGEENFFLELQFNKLGPQHLANRMLIELANKTGIKLVVTADSHYCRPDVWKEREIYKKLGWLNYSDYDPSQIPASKDELKADLYPKNASQMWQSFLSTAEAFDFYDLQQVADAIERSHDIAHQFIEDVHPDTSVKLPSWCVPKDKTPDEALREACFNGLANLGLADDNVYVERLNKELSVIVEKQFSKYFLTMNEICKLASEHMLIGVGRGSAAGSLINYTLGITQVDPIKYNLIFERFVNKFRSEFPDIDTDFADRDLLIKLLKEKYGRENVLAVSNFNTFQLKSLVKDVSRFFGVPFEEVNAATRTLDADVRKAVLKQGDDKNLFELKLDDAIKYCTPFREFLEKYPEIAAPLEVLMHENKSLGKHAGGVIIEDDAPMNMPIILSRGEPQTPWSEGMHFKHLNHFGHLKHDCLGLETLRIIQRCVELILERHGGKKLKLETDTNLKFTAYEEQSLMLNDGSWKKVKDVTEQDELAEPLNLRWV